MKTNLVQCTMLVALTAVAVGSGPGPAAAQQPAPAKARTWRAGGLEGRGPGIGDPDGDLCAALAPLEGLDLYVAVARGDARAGDVLVHLACGTRGRAASRAALIALAASGDRQDIGVLVEVAASPDPVRAADAVEALLLAGLPVRSEQVVEAYRASDAATRRRLLVAMSAGGAGEALREILEVETDEGLVQEARRRLDALR